MPDITNFLIAAKLLRDLQPGDTYVRISGGDLRARVQRVEAITEQGIVVRTIGAGETATWDAQSADPVIRLNEEQAQLFREMAPAEETS